MQTKLACLALISLFGSSSALLARADDAQDIQDLVFGCTRAGFERKDVTEFMKPWTDDAKIIEGREEKPGKYDHVITRKQLEGMVRLMFSVPGPEGGYKVTFESPRVEIDGDKAELRVMTIVKWDEEGENMERLSEIYLLRRTAGGWRVYENRFWMVESKRGDETIDYDASGWKALDAKVEAAEKEGDLARLVDALDDARRLVEAHKVAKKLTAGDGATADDWLRRGSQALSAGDPDDAIKAFREALKLDPDALVPEVIKGKTDKQTEQQPPGG